MVGANELPALMNSPTFRPNGGPHGALGAVGPRRIGTVDSMKSHGVTITAEQRAALDAERRQTEHDRLMALPDDDFRLALYRIFGKCKPGDFGNQHAAVDAALALAAQDGKARDIDYILTLAGQEYAPLHTELADFLKGQQAKMDARQESLPEKKPSGKGPFGKPVSEIVPTTARRPQTDAERAADLDATLGPDVKPDPAIDDHLPEPEPMVEQAPAPAKSLRDVWGEKMVAAYGKHAAAIEFARATSYKNWKAATDDGLDDAVIAKMLEDHMVAHPAATDVPAEPPAQKPAANVPPRDETPAPVPDVPAPRSDATAAQVAAIAGKPEPTPEPAIVTPATPRYEEWPFVALLTMYSPEGLEMKYTLRAASDAQLLDAERAFVARRLAAGYTVTRQASSPVHQQTVSLPISQQTASLPATPQLPTTAAPLPETVPQAAPATGGAPDKKGRVPGQTGTDRVTAIARNETNGKSVIEVFCGGKWPDHKLRRDEDVAMLRAAFPTLDVAAMAAGAQYPINATCTWVVTNNLNDKGTYWRDVTSIVAATPNL